MSALLGWLKWWFIETQHCDHDDGDWSMIDLGMSKIRNCTECGKCLQIT
jgi:hypothetical protein